MYVKTCGQGSSKREDMVKGKKWFSLTADYAFGHDLLRVSRRFVEKNGGEFVAERAGADRRHRLQRRTS